jgi:hypothetical protein
VEPQSDALVISLFAVDAGREILMTAAQEARNDYCDKRNKDLIPYFLRKHNQARAKRVGFARNVTNGSVPMGGSLKDVMAFIESPI